MLRSLSLRVKLAAFAAGVVLLVVLGQTFQSLAKEAVVVQEEISLRARLVLMGVAGAVSPLWTDEHIPELELFVARINKELDVQSLSILSPDGQVVAHHGRQPRGDEIKRATHLRMRSMPRSVWALPFQPQEFLVTAPILRGSEVRGYLLCAFRSDEPSTRLRRLVTNALWTVLFWVSVGGALSLWVAQRMIGPLVRLAEDLREVGRGGYVLPPDGAADGEIGLVQERLVELAEGLREERARVAELHAALEHQIHGVTADLERVAAQRQAILDSVRDAIAVSEQDGRVLSANGPARKVFGEEVVTGQRPLWTCLKEPEAVRGPLSRAASLRRPTLCEAETHAGDRWLRIRITPLSEARSAVVIVAEDLTESRQLREGMLRSERLASIGALTAGLAHQLGNHLNAIKGHADLLAGPLAGQAELLQDLRVIRKEVRRAADLMDRVLMLARTRPPTRAAMHVPTVVHEAADFATARAEAQGIELVRDLADPGCHALGEPQLFFEAVVNLLMNSIQSMPDGGRLQVGSACNDQGQCVVRVSDTGTGMSEEVRAHIFDPFFSTKVEGQGSGLGLPIAQRIIELHGGMIRVESQPGEGTTFDIVLPVTGDPQGAGGACARELES
jgi:PAS domain S-box-containing protein